LTVNGQATSEIPVRTNERIRLRLLNTANARIMPVRISGHEATVMALDGQPTPPFPAENSRVVLSPGSRCDLFIDAKLKSGASAPIMIDTGREEVEIARLIYVAEPKRDAPLPPARPLPSNALPERMDLVNAFRLEVLMEGGAMSMKMRDLMTQSRPQGAHGHPPRFIAWTLNGKASEGHDPDPLFSVKRGQTVVLSFPNETRFPHNIHIHGHHFRHLDDRDDSWKPYWLDTVLILPGKTERIAFIADNPGKWMIHCHMLEHQAAGMAAWFKVG
jgi:FtsP/CotA-like multicopper oxidase with cupredoxin domain